MLDTVDSGFIVALRGAIDFMSKEFYYDEKCNSKKEYDSCENESCGSAYVINKSMCKKAYANSN